MRFVNRGTHLGIIDAGAGHDIGGLGQTITLHGSQESIEIAPNEDAIGDWVIVARAGVVSQTSTQLNDIGGAINTSGKYAGRKVWNSTVGYFVYAVGSAAADVWVDGSGVTVNTPA